MSKEYLQFVRKSRTAALATIDEEIKGIEALLKKAIRDTEYTIPNMVEKDLAHGKKFREVFGEHAGQVGGNVKTLKDLQRRRAMTEELYEQAIKAAKQAVALSGKKSDRYQIKL